MSYKIQELLHMLDGVAGVNIAEPSHGDLERVIYAYADCRKERDELRAEVERLKDEFEREQLLLGECAVNINTKESRCNRLQREADSLRLSTEVQNELATKYKQALVDILNGKYKYYMSYDDADEEIPDYYTFIESVLAKAALEGT